MPPKPTRIGLDVGAQLNGHRAAYRISKRIAAGANGVVYRAVACEGDEMVAVKLFSPRDEVPQAAFKRLRENFKNEVPKTRLVSHWGVVQALDWGIATVDHRQVPFWVMEYAPHSLRKILTNDTLGLFTKCFYSALLCDALEYINTRGQVHRDIKPENILIDKMGLPKVADLGIAEFIPNFEAGILKDYSFYTELTDRKHPRHYFSPEQLRRAMGDKNVDLSHSDRFQLGKVIHEIFTGINPVGQLHPRSDIYRDVPKTVCQLLLSMLAQEGDQRPSLPLCAAVLYGEAAVSRNAAGSAVLKLVEKKRKDDPKTFIEWFRSDDTYDPDLSSGQTPANILMQRWTNAGLTRIKRRPADTQGVFKLVTLLPLGRDVRDMLIRRRSWRRVVDTYRALERSPSHRLPDWGTTDWVYTNPRRSVPVERLAFCKKYPNKWDAYVICSPLQLGGSWWVEIYDGELRDPERRMDIKEWLVPFGAPRWLKRGKSLQKVLAATRLELRNAGIAKLVIKKALAKLLELAIPSGKSPQELVKLNP